MSVATVPKGGLNKGIILPLTFSCPGDCVCKSNEPRNWHHKECGDPSFITQYGDIICKNHLKNCSGYFIKDAYFQCGKAKQSNTWYQHKSMSKLLMALSQALQVAEHNLGDNDLNVFSQNILQEVQKRWNS